jgi:hypothetical protein
MPVRIDRSNWRQRTLLALGVLLALLLQACGGGADVSASGNTVATPVVDRCASQAALRTSLLATNPLVGIDDAAILQYGFDAPTAPGWLMQPAISRVADVQAANAGIFMLVDGFEHAYDCIRINGAARVAAPDGSLQAVRVDFIYRDTAYSAWAYGSLPGPCAGGSAGLVIPGSGNNQSSAIINKQADNYHYGVIDALAGLNSNYVLIKPNEDSLAWHNGRGYKLSGEMSWNYHINRGGSYSVSYLVQAMAFTKWMKSCFDRTVLAGLSQGGAAVLLTAMQAMPTAAVVAAGHSLLFDQLEWAGHNQLLNVPGYAALAKRDTLVAALGNSPTRWLFAWGRADTDFYMVEASTRYTANAIDPLANVDISIHDGGHVFPVAAMQAFLQSALTDAPSKP